MRNLTITFVLALLVVAGCGSKAEKVPAAPPQPKAEAATDLPKLWDFWATWCPPCKQLKPIIEALETEYAGKIEIKSIDSDENKELAKKFNVQAIPTLVFLDAKGNELSRIVGLVPRDTIVGRFKTHGFIQ
ncbi:thioredoxin family protein [candidate division WOR-3 bacterium]|uniref:Thioredoxin family protein n=1 Tax=candidate division WOR-3 bacterium TaxID=2052148 RepID=A0A937XG42_UNCW3|nr:thioredoxin family protein [candidate division WOR-3 bacterium]